MIPGLRQPSPDPLARAAPPGRRARHVPGAGGAAAGPRPLPGPSRRMRFPVASAAGEAKKLPRLSQKSTVGRWGRVESVQVPSRPRRLPCAPRPARSTCPTNSALCSRARLLAASVQSSCHVPCTASALSRGSGCVGAPLTLRLRPLCMRSAHTDWWRWSSVSRA